MIIIFAVGYMISAVIADAKEYETICRTEGIKLKYHTDRLRGQELQTLYSQEIEYNANQRQKCESKGQDCSKYTNKINELQKKIEKTKEDTEKTLTYQKLNTILMSEKVCLTDLAEGVYYLDIKDYRKSKSSYPGNTGLRIDSCEEFKALNRFHEIPIKLVKPPKTGLVERLCKPTNDIKNYFIMDSQTSYENSKEFIQIKITISKQEKISGSPLSEGNLSAIQILVNAAIGAFFMGKAVKLLTEIMQDVNPIF